MPRRSLLLPRHRRTFCEVEESAWHIYHYWELHCLWNKGDQREPGFPEQNTTQCSTINHGINKTGKSGIRDTCVNPGSRFHLPKVLSMNRALVVTISFLAAIIGLAGCGHDWSEQESQSSLDAVDLARAQGMTWWQVQLPPDLEEDDTIAVAWKTADGEVTSDSGSTGWNAGSVVKVIVWPSENREKLKFAILAQNGDGVLRGEMKNRLQSVSTWCRTKTNERLAKTGVLLLKSNADGGPITMNQELSEGEFGLLLHVIKPKP